MEENEMEMYSDNEDSEWIFERQNLAQLKEILKNPKTDEHRLKGYKKQKNNK